MTLSPSHQKQLRDESGISDLVIRERGYRTVTERGDLSRCGFSRSQQVTPALLIPLWDVGGIRKNWQIRPDNPRKTKADRIVKYETPARSRMMLDCHPLTQPGLKDPQIPLWITEGVKKADSLTSHGELCIALMGVWNWRGRNIYGGLTTLPDWHEIALNGRTIYIIFDNDVARKPEVKHALRNLFRWLSERRDARPRVVYLPDTDEKLGADDALVKNFTVQDFKDMSEAKAPEPPEETQKQALARYSDDAVFFLTPEQEVYSRVQVDSHYEVLTVSERGSTFRRWLTHRYSDDRGDTPSLTTLNNEINRALSIAYYDPDTPTQPVYVRKGFADNAVYLDLGDRSWRCIEIDADGWRIINEPPVLFRRPEGLLPLPEPVEGGELSDLRSVLSLPADDDTETLLYGWLLGTLMPHGPYPHLCLHGEQGSAKSWTTRVLRTLVDPHISPTRSLPKDEESLALAAKHGVVVAIENVSGMTLEQSDWLCRLATGLGLSARKLYTDDQERVLYVQAPAIINGINEISTRGDLRDRSITVHLCRPDHYLTEEELLSRLRAIHASVLGALCDATSRALSRYRQLPTPPDVRMNDFARWVIAASPAIGWDDTRFLNAYRENQKQSVYVELEASLVGNVLMQYLDANREVKAVTPTSLLHSLRNTITNGGEIAPPKGWPGSAQALTFQLKRLAPALREAGYDYYRISGDNKNERSKIAITPVSDDKLTTNSDKVKNSLSSLNSLNLNSSTSSDKVDNVPVKKSEGGVKDKRVKSLSTLSTLQDSNKNNGLDDDKVKSSLSEFVGTLSSEPHCPSCGSNQVIMLNGRAQTCVKCPWTYTD